MSPIALLYILLASPIFSENIYSRRHFDEELLPVSHYSMKNVERLFRTSPLESILSTSTTPSWLRRSNIFGRRSIVNELYPESSIFGEEESTFEPMMSHFATRNVEVIRRLAETHPEMINYVIEKLVRPESRLWAEKLIRNVEPETLLFSHKLIKKNLPRHIREKIVRRLVKSVLPRSILSRSILSEVMPIESTLFSEPTMTKVLIEKIIRRKVEKRVVKKVLRMIKKSVLPYHVEESLFHSSTFSPINMLLKSSTEKRIVKKIVKRIVKRVVKKVVKNVLRHKRSFGGFSPMPWNNKACKMCTMCSYSWTPMCNMCETVCPMNWMTPSSSFTPSYYGKHVYGEKKIVKKINKLIKKLSTEELLF